MKVSTLSCWILLIFVTTNLNGQVIGRELEIGPVGSNQVFDPSGTLYGGGAIGKNNFVFDSEGASLAVGTDNQLNPYFQGFSANAAFGSGNVVDATFSVAIGSVNTFLQYESGPSVASLIVGSSNSVASPTNSSIVVGIDNFVGTGDLERGAMATFGMGLWNIWNHATIVGRYNADQPLIALPLLFAVGNGTADDLGQRSNAFEVYTDGTIVMRKRQGDILMGEFGN